MLYRLSVLVILHAPVTQWPLQSPTCVPVDHALLNLSILTWVGPLLGHWLNLDKLINSVVPGFSKSSILGKAFSESVLIDLYMSVH